MKVVTIHVKFLYPFCVLKLKKLLHLTNLPGQIFRAIIVCKVQLCDFRCEGASFHMVIMMLMRRPDIIITSSTMRRGNMLFICFKRCSSLAFITCYNSFQPATKEPNLFFIFLIQWLDMLSSNTKFIINTINQGLLHESFFFLFLKVKKINMRINSIKSYKHKSKTKSKSLKMIIDQDI